MNFISTKTKSIFSLIFLILFLVLLYYMLAPFTFGSWHIILHDVEKVTLGIQFGLFVLIGFILKLGVEKHAVQFTLIDCVLIAYITFLVLHITLLKPINPDPIFILENILLGVLYLCYRSIKQKQLTYIFWVVVLAGIHHIHYGIINQAARFAPGYGLSDIRGGFINQGAFAGFMACLSLIVLGLFFTSFKKAKPKFAINKWIKKALYIVVLSILLITLIYTNSRASWLAFTIGIMFYIWKTYNVGFLIRKIFKTLFSKLILYTLIIVFSVGAMYMLYQYKKDSANGRILIWKVTLRMIKDKPVFGYGINSFQSNYMLYQADYFKKNPNNKYKYLASDNSYAFNELLMIGVEQGLVGVFVVFVLGFVIIRIVSRERNLLNKNPLTLISQSGIFLIIVFGLFSYPTKILELKTMMILFLATLSNSSKRIIDINLQHILKSNTLLKIYNSKVKQGFTFIIILMIFLLGWYKINSISKTYKGWSYALLEMKRGNYKKNVLFGKSKFDELKNSGYFLGSYGHSLFKEQKYVKAIKVLEQALKLIPSTKICYDIGKCYEKLGNYKKAEEYWEIAANMVPAKFKPKYLIAKMYFENGQKQKAKKIALNLLNNKKVKVYSIEVHQILEELKEIIKEP